MTTYVCEHADCEAEGTERMPAGERYCAKHAPDPLPWVWGEDAWSQATKGPEVCRAIADSIVVDLDNRKAGIVVAPDGTEYQVNITVTLTPVLVDVGEEIIG
jgi:hypothetical protein